ncbi:carbamoyl-phosphate synthase (glutamine-hydrolyzing) large subunit [Halobacteriovorax marinus]|uniref:carbamoyl-phosphate synthase (glutamine-hydrolyzing) large subunit n=1 Tax=Halobacteriovorax marinus TaxID=97084 RepID=UPI003A8DDF65
MPLHKCLQVDNPKVLVLGSGALTIGQGGEFDYSGNQALLAIEEENISTVVINPNIATVQTNSSPNRKVYLYPLTKEWIRKVIEIERPHAIIGGFGGQSALNCLLELEEENILSEFNVTNLGTSSNSINITEDRDLFLKALEEIDIFAPKGAAVNSLSEALQEVESIGFPVIVRAAFALGGLGSGFASNNEELIEIVERALLSSPQVLIESSLRGWKEIEYEVMRDREGNCICICNMENFDPLGVHTGDSIVIAPSQTLSDSEYQLLRNTSIKIADKLEIIGECNVQFALDPYSKNFYVIEVNARLSRSSALASKASGYPIAFVAAKVVLGYHLLEISNPVTGNTSAFYEPSFDYISVKVPKWNFEKFPEILPEIDSTMKSVGEIMSIGRNFREAFQKAMRMVLESGVGLKQSMHSLDIDDVLKIVKKPTDKRVFAIFEMFYRGFKIEDVHEESRIDKWFLTELYEIFKLESSFVSKLTQRASENESAVSYIDEVFSKIPKEEWVSYKRGGFSEKQLVGLALEKSNFKKLENEFSRLSLIARKYRLSHDVRPCVKMIDTSSAEHPSSTNYLYMTYWGSQNDIEGYSKESSIIVLGGGAYRIGSSVEFDWCTVGCSEEISKQGYQSVMINCNPGTVSTDFNMSDKLYFEELTLERVLDIYDFENSKGVVVSMGGQRPNTLAGPLAESGVQILGHSAKTINSTEDRNLFSSILDKIGVMQPRFSSTTSEDEINKFVSEVGFPILVRPSFVLSGTAMNIATNEEELRDHVSKAAGFSNERPILLSEFIEGAREIEVDGVAKQGELIVSVIGEHLEDAGVHSGDATLLLPPQTVTREEVKVVKETVTKMISELKLNGPFNIQFLLKRGELKVIECNSRASRSFPFSSKVSGLNLAKIATDVAIGNDVEPIGFDTFSLKRSGVKASMFSFKRLSGSVPLLGVEMFSTGEVGCIDKNFYSALLLAFESTGISKAKKGILISSGTAKHKDSILKLIDYLKKFNLPIYGTSGTYKHLKSNGEEVLLAPWPGEAPEDSINLIKTGKVDLVINIPKSYQRLELTRGAKIRNAAVQNSCTLLTNIKKVEAYVKAYRYTELSGFSVKEMGD